MARVAAEDVVLIDEEDIVAAEIGHKVQTFLFLWLRTPRRMAEAW